MKDWPYEVHASGWYQVDWSANLAPGEVKPMAYFDEELLLFRPEDGGAAQVMGALCPHLGASLAYFSKVCGDSVECPFHGWRWNREGSNTLIPNSDRVSEKGRVKTFPTREIDGIVLVWYDVNGADPTWEWPGVPEFRDPDFYPIFPYGYFRYEPHKIQPQSMLENIADTQHFPFVHGAGEPGRHKMLEHDGAHLNARFALTFGLRDGGKPTFLTPDGPVEGEIHAEAWGVGLSMARASLGNLSFPQFLGVTPVDLNHGVMFSTITARRVEGADEPTGIVAKMYQRQHEQLFGDIRIWEHQRWLDKPLYAEFEGGPFAQVRRWARQFYPERVSS